MSMGGRRRRGLARVEVQGRVLRLLRQEPGGVSKAEFVRRVGSTSAQTMQRVLKELELEREGVVRRDRRVNRWVLVDPQYAQPLEAPDHDDLTAVVLASDAGGLSRFRAYACHAMLGRT